MIYYRRRRLTHFGNIKTLEKAHGFKRFYISPTVLIIKILIVCLLFMVATDSIELRQTRPLTQVDYVVVIDASPSMSNDDYLPSRLTAAKKISQDWLRILPNGTQVGLVSFSDSIDMSVDLTTNKEEIIKDIDKIQINYSKSGTAIAHALDHAFDLLQETEYNRSVLLVTDGTENIENITVNRAKLLDIKIYSFGIGSNTIQDVNSTLKNENFSDYYSSLKFNFTKLQKLADATHGQAYKVANSQELNNALRASTLEEVQIKLNSQYYIGLLIALISIFEFVAYAKLGGL